MRLFPINTENGVARDDTEPPPGRFPAPPGNQALNEIPPRSEEGVQRGLSERGVPVCAGMVAPG